VILELQYIPFKMLALKNLNVIFSPKIVSMANCGIPFLLFKDSISNLTQALKRIIHSLYNKIDSIPKNDFFR